eukprot:5718808-Pleurochrysis_carterae.AAC.1
MLRQIRIGPSALRVACHLDQIWTLCTSPVRSADLCADDEFDDLASTGSTHDCRSARVMNKQGVFLAGVVVRNETPIDLEFGQVARPKHALTLFYSPVAISGCEQKEILLVFSLGFL